MIRNFTKKDVAARSPRSIPKALNLENLIGESKKVDRLSSTKTTIRLSIRLLLLVSKLQKFLP